MLPAYARSGIQRTDPASGFAPPNIHLSVNFPNTARFLAAAGPSPARKILQRGEEQPYGVAGVAELSTCVNQVPFGDKLEKVQEWNLQSSGMGFTTLQEQ